MLKWPKIMELNEAHGMAMTRNFLLSLPFLLMTCSQGETIDELSKRARVQVLKGDTISLSSTLADLEKKIEILEQETLLRIFEGHSIPVEISLASKLFIARSMKEISHDCWCQISRQIFIQVLTESKHQIFDNINEYTQVSQILKMLAESCNDDYAEMLRSVLALGMEINYSSVVNGIASSPNSGHTEYLKGLGFWLEGDYQAAFDRFRSAQASGCDFGLLNSGSLFLKQYNLRKQYEITKQDIVYAEQNMHRLSLQLAEELEIKDAAWKNATSIDKIDIALFLLKKAEINKSLTKTATGLSTLMDLKKAVDLYRSYTKTIDLQEGLKETKAYREHSKQKLQSLGDPWSKRNSQTKISKIFLLQISEEMIFAMIEDMEACEL